PHQHPACAITHGYGAAEVPAVNAVRTAEAVLQLKRFTGLDGVPPAPDVLVHVVGVDELQPPPAFNLVEGKPGELRPLLVEIIHVPVGVGGEDLLRYGLGQEAVAVLAGAQRRLQPLALRDVLDIPDEITRIARRVALERDAQLHPDGRAVPAEVTLLHYEAGRLTPQECPRQLGAGWQVVGVRDVPDGPLEQLLAGVADDGAELLVDAQEAAPDAHVGDADRRVLEPPAEPLLALAQRFLGPLVIGDVDPAAHETNGLAPGVAHGHAPGEHPAVGTVLVARTALDFILAGLPGQVFANGLLDERAIVRMERGHAGLMVEREIGAFVAELLPEVHVIHTPVAGGAVRAITAPADR